MLDDTIAAIATGPQSAAVAIVRLSGPDSVAVCMRLVPGLGRGWEPRRLTLRRVVDNAGTPLDRALVVVMPGPTTFTGEDVVELHIHGGTVQARRVLDAALAAGARMAAPGEFSRRAFLNGRMDLAQAEAIADIAGARSYAALDAAQAQLGGVLSREVEAVRDRIATLLARVEVNIDFSAEDVPTFPLRELATSMDEERAALERLAGTFERGRALREGLHVALIGRPNVGKSSLFNALLQESRAIVTPIPGTTRDLIEETASIRGYPVVLVDTAGLRDTEDPIEREGIARTRARLLRADVVVRVFDGSRPPGPEDELTRDAGSDRALSVLNKRDLGLDPAWAPTLLRVSATTGEGIEALADALLEAAGLDEPLATEAAVVTRARHRAALDRAVEALAQAAEAARLSLPHEIVAGELQLALLALGDIVGATTAEDILDRIFATFCIGK
ncbi:MAG: tRNA modification GTPase MnmE [Myxococcales bacterium]